MVDNRTPPYNEEAEIAVLGSILLNNDCLAEILSIINDSDFYIPSNKLIFNGMVSLFEEGIAIDHVTLGNKLKLQGNLQKIGGAIALSNLTDAVAVTANISYYVNIVREASAIRRVIESAQKVAVSGFSADNISCIDPSINDLIDAAHDLYKTKMPDNLFSIGNQVIENYRKVANGYRGIELPWKSMDSMTAGAWPKTITMFVARPGVGKTFVAVICARHAWLNNRRVLVISPEMSKDEIAERFFVIHSSVSYHSVISGQLPTIMEQRFEKTILDSSGKDGLWIMDSDDDLTPRGMESAIRACNPDLVAIDSIYDIHLKGDRKDRAIGALSWMKKSSKEFGHATIGFAQQNRIAELSEKKGGGARLGTIALADEIGQDAHAVFALEQTQDDKDDKIMKIKKIKLRRGNAKRPSIKVHWDMDRMFFDEIVEEDDGDEDDIPF